jgi:hypothetical protein
MGKSRGERRVIFSSSGAIHTTSASHLRRLLLTGAATRERATAPEADAAADMPRAAAGAERHHGDAMGQGKLRDGLAGALDSLGFRWVGEVGLEFGSRAASSEAPAALRDRLVRSIPGR